MAGQKHIILLAARHGDTIENEKDIFRGDSNPPLDKKGFQEAHELSFYLQPIEFSHVFYSGKKRTEQTVKAILDGRKEKPIANEGFFPWDTGIFAGKPKNKENREKLQYYVEHPDVPIPGGVSLNDFRARVRPLLQEAIQLGYDSSNPVLLVLHSSVIHELGDLVGNNHEAAHVKPGGVAAVYIQDGKLGVEPIFKPDERSTSQNVLGTVDKGRSSLTS